MIHCLRWFGEQDVVSLSDIRQAGATSVVTALHHIPVGETWSKEEILKRKAAIEATGLSWNVVESLPVHDDIKKRKGLFEIYISNYKASMKNLAECGMGVITYNFMPAMDWVRTDLSYRTVTGVVALRFEWNAYMSFDLFILKRPNAEKDYTEEQVNEAKKYYSGLNSGQRDKLAASCLLGLPGSAGSFSREQVLQLLGEYDHISEQQLQRHLFLFLNEITPLAEGLNIKLAIHPDDPPFPVFGLPRIMSTSSQVEDLFKNVPSESSGLCFCTGSFGARADNDLLAMLNRYSKRIYFLHLRSIKNEGQGNFHEANHLEGDANLISIIRNTATIQNEQRRSIPMRPDHGHLITDMDKAMYPGYSYIGRLKALAEIRGVEETVQLLLPNGNQSATGL